MDLSDDVAVLAIIDKPVPQVKHRESPRRNKLLSSEENELSILQIAMTHSQSWVELHANQRQNLLNFFLIAVAFLFNAYVGALSEHRYILAGTISLLGALISFGFTLMDLRNRDLTRAGEVTLKHLEDRIARELDLPSIRIIEAIDQPRYPWMSIGKIIRTIHIAVGLVFLGASVYAFIA